MKAPSLRAILHLDGNKAARPIRVDQAVIAGWTGRDPKAVEKHIAELEALNVKRPASVPIFYRVAAARLTTSDMVEAVGERSSGEVEYVLLKQDGRLWVGVGSDHTDREAETYNITVSKQMCEKPIAPEFWAYDEVSDHWDELILRSFILEDGRRVLYQEGRVSEMLHPESLLARWNGEATLSEGGLMLCGTLAARGGIRPSARFEFELDDPVLGRQIRHGYSVITLPVLG